MHKSKNTDASVSSRHTDLKSLYKMLRDAALYLQLPDGVVRTAEMLIRYIPSDAPRPISPARVQDLADDRGVGVRTIYQHIQRLVALDLVQDATVGGGHRTIRRRSGAIVSIAGIDFSPMCARATEFRTGAALQRAERDECIALRTEISHLRRRATLLAGSTSSALASRMRESLTALPRRYDRLSLAELAQLRDRLLRIVTCLADLETETVPETRSDDEIADQSEVLIRPNSLRESKNPVVPPLPVLLTCLPDDWQAEITGGGQRNWRGMIAVAYARSVGMGVPQRIWDDLAGHAGLEATAALILIADTGAQSRGGSIRSPSAWLARIADCARSGPLDLTRNILSIQADGTRCRGIEQPGFKARGNCGSSVGSVYP